MSQSLAEYAESLAARPGLIWPKPPAVRPIQATPTLKPLGNVRAVAWNLYGTLLRIDTGQLHLLHPQPLRMQVALQKTIDEFRMWHSMSRKPGQPWEYLLQQYTALIEGAQLTSPARKGDIPQVDATAIWDKLIERLERNEYQWDRDKLGDRADLALKVAYFFHTSLQGVAPADGAAEVLTRLATGRVRQALLSDAQSFSEVQTLRAFSDQRNIPPVRQIWRSPCSVVSIVTGVRKPSNSMFETAVQQWRDGGLEPSQVLYVSHQLRDDLAVARRWGFRTALVVADANCTQVDKQDVRSTELRPDRLLTDLRQIVDLLTID
ncbi:MAG: HAD hydrolase-like protein [Planctomycetaceae bacterium]